MPRRSTMSPTSRSPSRPTFHAAWRRIAPWLLPIGVLLAWELSSRSGWLSTRVLPEPLAVVKAFWALLLSGEMAQHVATSTGRALAGFVIGGGLGRVLCLLSR